MKTRSTSFRIADAFYLLMIILPLICAIVLKILTSPQTNDISITGAQIYFTLKMPIQNLPITESQVNSWLVLIMITGICLYLTHGITPECISKRQLVAEWLVESSEKLVSSNMSEYFNGFAPFTAAIISLSALSSFLALFGLYAPTSDLNVPAGWAILVLILITYYKFKCGFGIYVKSFAEPVGFLTPLNIINELATPISMAFRHYGNILSGGVISVLLSAGLQKLSAIVFSSTEGLVGSLPLLQIGLPAIISIYFDVFSGCLQAYIFAVLTMLYISGGFPEEEYFRRKSVKKLS